MNLDDLTIGHPIADPDRETLMFRRKKPTTKSPEKTVHFGVEELDSYRARNYVALLAVGVLVPWALLALAVIFPWAPAHTNALWVTTITTSAVTPVLAFTMFLLERGGIGRAAYVTYPVIALGIVSGAPSIIFGVGSAFVELVNNSYSLSHGLYFGPVSFYLYIPTLTALALLIPLVRFREHLFMEGTEGEMEEWSHRETAQDKIRATAFSVAAIVAVTALLTSIFFTMMSAQAVTKEESSEVTNTRLFEEDGGWYRINPSKYNDTVSLFTIENGEVTSRSLYVSDVTFSDQVNAPVLRTTVTTTTGMFEIDGEQYPLTFNDRTTWSLPTKSR